MKILLLLSLASISLSLFASATKNEYYGPDFSRSMSKGISKEELFKILNKNHVSVTYSTARKILFGELHIENDRNGKYVEDVYCGKKFYFRFVDDVSNMGNQVNIEHTWPQSKFTGRFDRQMQKSDLHHLFPTDSMANNRRGNYHFGNVSEREDELNVHDCDSSRLGHAGGKRIFNPPTEHRGNVARALFYFATRYDMDIPGHEEVILRQWHTQDPVDAAEIERHEVIVKYQQVRNPFVDFPELVGKISNL